MEIPHFILKAYIPVLLVPVSVNLTVACFRVGASPGSFTQTCQTALISWMVSGAPGLFFETLSNQISVLIPVLLSLESKVNVHVHFNL